MLRNQTAILNAKSVPNKALRRTPSAVLNAYVVPSLNCCFSKANCDVLVTNETKQRKTTKTHYGKGKMTDVSIVSSNPIPKLKLRKKNKTEWKIRINAFGVVGNSSSETKASEPFPSASSCATPASEKSPVAQTATNKLPVAENGSRAQQAGKERPG